MLGPVHQPERALQLPVAFAGLDAAVTLAAPA